MNEPTANTPPGWVKPWAQSLSQVIAFWRRARKNDPNDANGLGEMYQRLLSHDDMETAWDSIKKKCGDSVDVFVPYICLMCEDGFLGPQTTTENFPNKQQRGKHIGEVASLARELANKIRGSTLDRERSFIDADDVCRRGRAPIMQDALNTIYANRITPSQLLDEIAEQYGEMADAFDTCALHKNKLTVRRQYFVRTLKRGLESCFDDVTDLDDAIVEITRAALDDENFTKTTMKNWKDEQRQPHS